MSKEKIKNIITNKIFVGIVAIILPFIIELLKFQKIEINIQTFMRIGLIYGVYVLIGIYFLLKKYSEKLNKIAEILLKYRYQIAGVALVVLVLFKINMSSLEQWSGFVNEPESSNVLLGVSRGIRSDDWLVQSAIMLGQAKSDNGYAMYNENIGQGKINLLMVSAPVADLVILAKPFLWGFLLFGAEYGFSFYWMLKIIALLLVSIEVARKITKKDNLLTITGGIMLALAPAIMWWFSSSIADGYIYGMATVILFSYYMNNLDWKLWKKIGIAIGLLISTSSFALTLYPAFQVPFAFLMAIFMLNDFIPNVKKLKKQDYILMGITILGIAGLIGRFLLLCWNDIQTMMSTAYPGNRIAVGGEFTIDRFISYFANIFFPYSKGIANPCEPSSYIYPFIGLIILMIYSIKNIKQDKKESTFALIVSLIVLYIIYLLWEFVGFGETLAKLTFMSMSPTPRTHVVVGLIGTLLTIIMVKKFENKKIFTKAQAIAISILVVLFGYVLIKESSYASFFPFIKLEIFAIVFFSITYFLIRGNKKAWCYCMSIVAIVAGATVNPICIGTSPLYETKISQAIQEIKMEDPDALWAGNTNITSQYLIANGVDCLNGVHTYPSFGWLKKIDPEGKYDYIYNRYAHIHITLGEETSFVLLVDDSYQAILTYDNVKELGIKYYYSSGEMPDEIINEFKLEPVYSDKEAQQYIYKIN